MYNNKISVKINCYKGFSYNDTLDGIQNAGFHYLELSTSSGNSLNLSQDMTFNELDIFKEDLNNRSLIPISIGGNSYLMDEDINPILKNIRIGKYLGCKYVVTNVFNPRSSEELSSTTIDVSEHIKRYIPYLKENDLDLVIELHGAYSTGKIVNEIIDLVNDEHVHINYDTGNALYWGKLEVDEMLLDFKDSINNITHMHLKDKLDKKDVWNFPAIGKGYMPFVKIFDMLKENNNNANLSVEIEFTEEGVKDVKIVDQALIDSANYLKSLGLIL